MSTRIVPDVSAAINYPISTVREEWPERDLSVNPVPDQEIIPYLGGKGGHLAVWITQDWSALGDFKLLLGYHRISVLWLRGPGGRSLQPHEQAMITTDVFYTVRRIVVESSAPVYLRARYDPDGGSQSMLERLQGSLRDTPLRWERVPLR